MASRDLHKCGTNVLQDRVIPSMAPNHSCQLRNAWHLRPEPVDSTVAVRTQHSQVVEVCLTLPRVVTERHSVVHFAKVSQRSTEHCLKVELARLAAKPPCFSLGLPFFSFDESGSSLPPKVLVPPLLAFAAHGQEPIVNVGK